MMKFMDKEIAYRVIMDPAKYGLTTEDALAQDMAEEYVVVNDISANGGIVVHGKFDDEWTANPWSVRFLIRELLSERDQLRAEVERLKAERDKDIAAAVEAKMRKIWAELDRLEDQDHGNAEYGYIVGWSEAVSSFRDEIFPYGRPTTEQSSEGEFYWFCEKCMNRVPGVEVTYEEYHDGDCGGKVVVRKATNDSSASVKDSLTDGFKGDAKQ